MQQAASNPPLAVAASTAAVQQVQSPTKFEIPAFEGDSAASRLMWKQRVVRRYFQHVHLIPIVGVGKRGAY